MKNKLYIIGNGLDLAHNLPTRFDPNFKNIAMEYEQDNFWDLYQSCENDIWSDFENLLGCPDFESLEEIFYGYEPDYLSDRESDRDSIVYQVELNGKLQDALYEFANNAEEFLINIQSRAFFENIFDSDGYYITFNYTHTLEKIYNIPWKNILHVHGEVGKNNLKLGYPKGKFTPEKYSYDARGKGRGPYIKIKIEDYINGIEDYYIRTAYEELLDKCKSFYKEIRIDTLKDFLDKNQCKIEEIIVYGHSCAIDFEKAQKLIDRCMEKGINYYDTAYIYHGGKSEEFLGKTLAKYPRDSFYVTDKYNFQAEPDYKKQFAEQLKRMNMEWIDFYLLHGIQDAFADEMVNNGCITYFDERKKAGQIRYLGFSFHGSAEKLKYLLTLYPWDFVQIQLNYYDWYHGDAKELYDILKKVNIPIMVMEPVRGGMLANLKEEAAKELAENGSDKSQASWALRWVMNQDQVQVILSGMSTEEQIEDNIRTFSEGKTLTEKERESIRKAARIQYESVAVACTGCRYCTPNCPKKLDIPYLLKNYNEAKLGGTWRITDLLQMPEEQQPSVCIDCKACMKHCPQSFEIPKYLKELSDMLEEMKK